ncbi:TadE/TadG family type IV pilus assembly protein [Bacteroides sp.]|uniref:TadE/TadG family type IV pilus assembly protein n=1 Tax=Bacteroides sp. TaxID=29523 RepID=UPI003AAB8BBA
MIVKIFLKKVVKTLNNKGQSFVTFVMLLPIIIILLAIVVDVGNLAYTKHKYETEIQ